MTAEDGKKDENVSNINNESNIAPTLNNTTPPTMYYYQPFRPPVGYNPYPQGYPNYQGGYNHPVYPQMYMPHISPFSPVHTPISGQNRPAMKYDNQQRPSTQAKPPYHQVKSLHPQVRPQRPNPVHQTTAKNLNKSIEIKTLIPNYNLDDPEELEKWKAERRKRFPSSKEAVREVKEEIKIASDVSTEEKKIVCDSNMNASDEEGALIEENKEVVVDLNKKKKRFCKYFSRGKCNKGDSCSFEHSKENQPAKRSKSGFGDKDSNLSSSSASKPTIFENLLKIQEKETMIKFHECIKIIVCCSQIFNKEAK